MANSYHYNDPDFIYTNQNGVLRNLENIEDERVLMAFESLQVTRRVEQLFDQPIIVEDSSTLFYLHHFLFQDVYAWAGKVRTVNISKSGKPFFEGERFHTAFKYLDSLIQQYKVIPKNNNNALAYKLAEILDNVNYLHPFREGNGRVQREFLRLLALEKGKLLNLNPPDNASVYERYMQGTIHGDLNVLVELIIEQLAGS
jgi:cell filamentation protein